MPDLLNIKVPLPPLDAQPLIVAELQPKIEARRLIAPRLAKLHEVLADYRDSLIHEAVTGKLETTNATDGQVDERLDAAVDDGRDEVGV
ncbi:MAG: hypothetical protein WKF96_24220 [Solirubrobacteraceae bacterium]